MRCPSVSTGFRRAGPLPELRLRSLAEQHLAGAGRHHARSPRIMRAAGRRMAPTSRCARSRPPVSAPVRPSASAPPPFARPARIVRPAALRRRRPSRGRWRPRPSRRHARRGRRSRSAVRPSSSSPPRGLAPAPGAASRAAPRAAICGRHPRPNFQKPDCAIGTIRPIRRPPPWHDVTLASAPSRRRTWMRRFDSEPVVRRPHGHQPSRPTPRGDRRRLRPRTRVRSHRSPPSLAGRRHGGATRADWRTRVGRSRRSRHPRRRRYRGGPGVHAAADRRVVERRSTGCRWRRCRLPGAARHRLSVDVHAARRTDRRADGWPAFASSRPAARPVRFGHAVLRAVVQVLHRAAARARFPAGVARRRTPRAL